MNKKIFFIIAVLGAVAVWLGFLKNSNGDEEWEGTVTGKRETLNGLNNQHGQLHYMLDVELDDGESSEVEVDADLFAAVGVGDRVAQGADETFPYKVE